jgi:hypothetical protein
MHGYNIMKIYETYTEKYMGIYADRFGLNVNSICMVSSAIWKKHARVSFSKTIEI